MYPAIYQIFIAIFSQESFAYSSFPGREKIYVFSMISAGTLVATKLYDFSFSSKGVPDTRKRNNFLPLTRESFCCSYSLIWY
jgi:hypothetical protein